MEKHLLSSDLFEKIESGNGNENKCTPKVDMGFIGLRINAPDEVHYKPGERDSITGVWGKVIICGVYGFDASFVFKLNETVTESITLVAIDTVSHKHYVAGLVDNNPKIPDPSPPQYSPEELEGLSYIGYFNINMLEFLNLPEKPAMYNVFVTLKQYKSNVVTITIKSRE